MRMRVIMTINTTIAMNALSNSAASVPKPNMNVSSSGYRYPLSAQRYSMMPPSGNASDGCPDVSVNIRADGNATYFGLSNLFFGPCGGMMAGSRSMPIKTMTQPPKTSDQPAQKTNRGRGSGRITIVDVAREANVSPMTISRALKTPQLVQAASRERIAAAIAKLGYVPSQAASTLASSKSKVIGVIVPSFTNAVFIETLSGIRDCLGQEGYQFLIGETGYSPEQESQLIATHLKHAPDGFLLTGVDQLECVQSQLRANRIPMVRMFDLGKTGQDLSVGFSQSKAGYAVAQHLIARGYKKPGFLAAQLDPRVMKRRAGFRKGLTEAGMDPDIEVLMPCPSDVRMGAELLGLLLERNPGCDAVFCCNDDLALGALFECQRRGLAVPAQMAIAGFNDLPWSACANPTITTVVTPRYEIGYQAAQLLIRQIRGEAVPRARIDLGFELALREST
jgi:LacI family gluconate utilization system Gnt-I transcriptional repressor